MTRWDEPDADPMQDMRDVAGAHFDAWPGPDLFDAWKNAGGYLPGMLYPTKRRGEDAQ